MKKFWDCDKRLIDLTSDTTDAILRPIIIDGPNVAYGFGEKMPKSKSNRAAKNGKIFSMRGVKKAYDFFVA